MVEGTTVGKNPEEIRQEIEGTRASLDEKIHNLESNVHDAVHAAKEKLSPSHYIEAHPWACFGAAVGVGFLLGQLTVGASHDHESSSGSSFRGFRGRFLDHSSSSNGNGHGSSHGLVSGAASGLASSGLMMAASKFFDKEIRDLRNYAISQAMGVAKEIATGAVSPELSPRIGEVFDRAQRYFGVKPATPATASAS